MKILRAKERYVIIVFQFNKTIITFFLEYRQPFATPLANVLIDLFKIYSYISHTK